MKTGAVCVCMLVAAALSPPPMDGQVRPVQTLRSPVVKQQLQPDLQVAFPRFSTRPALLRSISLMVRNTGKAAAKNFFVDFILSSDRSAPVQSAVFSETWREDVLVKGGRMHIDRLAPGASRTLNLPLPVFRPRGVPKVVYLGAVADPGKAVAETDERNNTAFLEYNFPAPRPVHISGVDQTTIMGSDSGNIELHIGGSGFGAVPDGRVVKLGPHTVPVEEYNGNYVGWTDTWLNALVKDNLNIPYGQTYNLRIMKGALTISNTVQVLLKVDLEGVMLQGSSSGFIWQAHGGDILEVYAYKLPAAQGAWTVRFGPQTAAVQTWSPNKVVISCPALPPGNYKLWIANNGVDVSLSRYNMTVLP